MEKLIERVRKNEKLAQEEFYKRFSATMFRIAYRYVNNEQDAAAIVNMAFFKIFRSIHEFIYRDECSMIGWMKRITVNESLMFLRKHIIQSNAKWEEAEENPDELTSDDNLMAEDYYRIIKRLPDLFRTVFNLFAIDGFTHKEIAEQLDIKEVSSRVYLNKARKLLQDYICEKRTCDERK